MAEQANGDDKQIQRATEGEDQPETPAKPHDL
jgi:hypothetical protein